VIIGVVVGRGGGQLPRVPPNLFWAVGKFRKIFFLKNFVQKCESCETEIFGQNYDCKHRDLCRKFATVCRKLQLAVPAIFLTHDVADSDLLQCGGDAVVAVSAGGGHEGVAHAHSEAHADTDTDDDLNGRYSTERDAPELHQSRYADHHAHHRHRHAGDRDRVRNEHQRHEQHSCARCIVL